ncbi:glycosyl transferase [Bacillus velezensis]|uniref:glycosyl transferase n=1 Tax=Bacillus TaxID=1386 RepID=UPI0011B56EB7|nr:MULTISPECIES: glycosyl transferase [Bacillus amyloliquefaciens group]MEC3632480.1 glycosyl transferase [Bacillus velezensis]QGJ64768.1 glycosyl transferase [Bacillus velezensis]
MNISGEIQAAFRQLTAEIPPDRQDGGKDSGAQRLLLGKVLRLLDDQSALIQIGGRTMQGKLETALRPQAYYWFSYDKQPAEKTGRLHVIDQFEGSPKTVQEAAGRLLNALSVKPGPVSLQIAETFMQQKLPMTENSLKACIRWAESLPASELKKAAETIVFALKRELPAHPEVLSAIHAVKYPVPTRRLLSGLLQAINQAPQSAKELSVLKEAVSDVLNAETDLHAERLLKKLAGAARMPISETGLMDEGERTESKQSPFVRETRENGKAVSSQPSPPSARTDPELPEKTAKQIIEKLMTSAEKTENRPVKVTAEIIKAFISQEKTFKTAPVLQKAHLTEQEAAVFGKAVQLTELKYAEKDDVLSLLQKIKKGLGTRDELSFITALEKGVSPQPEKQALKTALQAVRTLQEAPQSVKQEAEPLIHKLNGQLFIEQHNPSFTQMVLSFPLGASAYENDITVLFKGRKKPDGKLDPSHCRLLFLLHLETLQETVVDCMIQQNVMTITVETDFELQAAIDPLVPALKEAVKETGFSLSGVTSKKRRPKDQSALVEEFIEKDGGRKVDVKI